MTRAPLVSVAIPVYNGGDYIGEAIQSLINQTCENWILAVCDNASTDNTREIVRSFADKRVRLFANDEHLPADGSWSRCLRHAEEAEFFQMLCADDMLHPFCLERKLAEAQKPENAGCVLFSSRRMLVAANGRRLFSSGFSNSPRRATLREIARATALRTNPIGDPGTVLMRSAAAKEEKEFRGQLTLDIDFWLRIMARGELLHIPETLSYFRLSGMTGKNFFANFREYMRFYRECVRPLLPGSRALFYSGCALAAARFSVRQAVYSLSRLAPPPPAKH